MWEPRPASWGLGKNKTAHCLPSKRCFPLDGLQVTASGCSCLQVWIKPLSLREFWLQIGPHHQLLLLWPSDMEVLTSLCLSPYLSLPSSPLFYSTCSIPLKNPDNLFNDLSTEEQLGCFLCLAIMSKANPHLRDFSGELVNSLNEGKGSWALTASAIFLWR